MRRRKLRALPAVVIAFLLGGGAGAVEVVKIRPAPRSDEEVAAEVQRVIAGRPGVETDRVRVAVREGRLTLGGSVPDLHSRAEAERLAAAVRGVVVIENEIAVDHPEVPDSLLELNVTRALDSSPRLRSFSIRPSVAAAALTLAGVVPLVRDRLEAERLASQVRGLQSIENRIRIAPAPVDPELLRRRIARLLGDRLVFGRIEELEVEVAEGGVVRLAGLAASHTDRLQAERLAYGVRGVTEVRNQIRVRIQEDDAP